jgi:ATP-dependent Clp protease ATP-binding subunit ClpA
MRRDVFEIFTPEAKRAMFVARHNAFLDGSALIAGRHLLCALLTGNDSTFVTMLAHLRLNAETMRKSLPPIPAQAVDSRRREIPFSSELKNALEVAKAEAARLTPPELGTRQLLLGLLATEGNVPVDTIGGRSWGREDLRAAAAGAP